jgi:hypothetical protein
MSTGQKSGKGTHGSLTKAGKVRHNTPLDVDALRKVVKPVKKKGNSAGVATITMVMHHKKKHDCPRVAKKRLAHLRMTQSEGGLDRKAGQWYCPAKM